MNAPNRYTYDTWPKPGTKGHHVNRPDEPLILERVYHHFYACFFTGYSWVKFNLQDFVES